MDEISLKNQIAVQATFSDYRTVKGRKTLQLVFEVPLEHAANVFSILGFPMPDAETWVAIARLNLSTPALDGEESST